MRYAEVAALWIVVAQVVFLTIGTVWAWTLRKIDDAAGRPLLAFLGGRILDRLALLGDRVGEFHRRADYGFYGFAAFACALLGVVLWKALDLVNGR